MLHLLSGGCSNGVPIKINADGIASVKSIDIVNSKAGQRQIAILKRLRKEGKI